MERSPSEHTLHMSKPDNFRVQSATEWTASVHTLHMSKPVITFVFKVLRNGLLRHILYTCPNLITFVFKVLRNELLRYILLHKFQFTKGDVGKIHSCYNPLYPLNNKGFFLEKQSQSGGSPRLYVRRHRTTANVEPWAKFYSFNYPFR